MEVVETDCCIAGGGPAGMMLGLLLARAGIRVVVLEKHADFLRDFRGDTIHPSTLDVMDRIGLLDDLLRIPHQEVPRLVGQWETTVLPLADFSRVPACRHFIALMPQWDFLDLLASAGRRLPGFDLRMRTEAREPVGSRDGSGWRRVEGLRAVGPAGDIEVRAKLVVGCDGRHSRIRDAAGLRVDTLGAPMDVVWFALPHHADDGEPPLGRFFRGGIFVLIPRGDHWQCGYVIAKGSIDTLRSRGFDAFRDAVATAIPAAIHDARERMNALKGWDDVSLLSVTVDRLEKWALDGLLCIGDAAHAMSPIGGVGINLAIQDAVAASNLIGPILKTRRPALHELERVQQRRLWPTRMTQRMQLVVQDRVVARALSATGPMELPIAMRVISRVPMLQRVVARIIGIGLRRELPAS